MLRYCLLMSVLGGASQAFATDEMSVEFSFRGSRGCTTVFPNPEIKLKNVPAAARLVHLRFRNGKSELGGQEILRPTSDTVPPDSIRTWGPCNAGVYTYDAIVKTATGEVLAKAERSEPFPRYQ